MYKNYVLSTTRETEKSGLIFDIMLVYNRTVRLDLSDRHGATMEMIEKKKKTIEGPTWPDCDADCRQNAVRNCTRDYEETKPVRFVGRQWSSVIIIIFFS